MYIVNEHNSWKIVLSNFKTVIKLLFGTLYTPVNYKDVTEKDIVIEKDFLWLSNKYFDDSIF